MLLLAYRNLRSRPARTLLTALAIAFGVGMIFAMRIVAVAVTQTTTDARANRLAGADLEVASAYDATISDTLLARFVARPEILAATAVYRNLEGTPDAASTTKNPLFGATLKGTGLGLLGVDPVTILTTYELTEGSFFSAPDAQEVLLPSAWAAQNGMRIGSQIKLTTGQRTASYLVAGLLKSDALSGSPAAWMPLRTMQAAFDAPNAATTILLRLKPGYQPDSVRDAIQQDLGVPYLVTSATGGANLRSFFNMLTDSALPFAGIAVLLTGSFLVYNAFAITLAERRREISQLRTLGMTRSQVLRQTLIEALLIALLGSAIGLLLGLLLGRSMMTIFVELMQGETIERAPLPLDGMLIAVGAGVLVTLAVTFNLARQAGRISPLEGLRIDAGHETSQSWYMRWGWVGALAALAVFALSFMSIAQVSEQYDTGFSLPLLIPFLLAIAAIFAIPSGIKAALWLFERMTRYMGAAGLLAGGSIARQPGRAALTTATLLIGLMLVVALSGILLTMRAFQDGAIFSLFRADFMLIRPMLGMTLDRAGATPALPPMAPDLQADIDRLNGEAQVLYLANAVLPGYSVGGGVDNGFAMSIALVRENPNFVVAEGSWAEADRYFAQGPALILPELAARRHNVRPGDSVEIDTLEGKVRFTVALVGGPVPVISSEAGAKYFHTYPFMIFLNARPGVDKQALEAKLDALSQQYGMLFTPNLQETFVKIIDQIFSIVFGLFIGLTSLSSLIAALGIINTLIASVLERQREIGMLRALGMSRGQVRRLVVIEGGLLGITGALMGAVAGLAISYAFNQTIVQLGAQMGMSSMDNAALPWNIAGIAMLLGPLITMLAAFYPAARAAGVDPADAMRAEEGAGFPKAAAR